METVLYFQLALIYWIFRILCKRKASPIFSKLVIPIRKKGKKKSKIPALWQSEADSCRFQYSMVYHGFSLFSLNIRYKNLIQKFIHDIFPTHYYWKCHHFIMEVFVSIQLCNDPGLDDRKTDWMKKINF